LWKQVDGFHSAALAHGGTSEGPPALRLQYGPDFYAAYVRDPDGNKVAGYLPRICTTPIGLFTTAK
jgi:hypothetical protein